MNIELPKDAEGREIPLDTVVLFDKDGQEIEVLRYQYYPKVGPGHWNIKAVRNKFYRQDEVYLTPPDSWEKLEEDLDGCIEKDEVCYYYNKNEDCRSCPISGNNPNGCISEVFKDVKKRIRNLRGGN